MHEKMYNLLSVFYFFLLQKHHLLRKWQHL